jgi:hypothetical protein
MRTSEQINELATALAKAQAEMKNAKLNKINPHFKSRYADLAEIRDTVTPALSKNGIAVVHGLDTAENGIAVVTRLIHASGQWVESRFPVAYDKPQTMGSAITYGRRYNLSAIANISADDDDDANAANEKAPVPHAKPEAMPAVNGTPGASKAASRSNYDGMVKSIRNAATVKALMDWYKANVTEIDALPADWLDELRVEYADRKSELEKVLA